MVELMGGLRGLVLDATVGGGGHASALLRHQPHLSVVGLDRDPVALRAARSSLEGYGSRARLFLARFDHLEEVLEDLGSPELAGALFDLGVSSPQLDDPARGFSYRAQGPLDMRMGPDAVSSAAEVVNEWPLERLARLFADNGEGRLAMRIARAVVAARPIAETTQLAEVVASAVPVSLRRRGHPARRVFQALRIAVNEELEVLAPALEAARAHSAHGARIVVISYHSGEDSIVKSTFARWESGGCSCPSGYPCVCGAVPLARRLTRGAKRPRPEELERNPRSRSARLRAAEVLEPASQLQPQVRQGRDQ